MLIGFKEYKEQAQRLAVALGMSYAEINVHYFPDEECKVTLPKELPFHVVFCRSLDRPNSKLIELLLAAKTARNLGADRITLVAPYLCYMRQDTAFNPGEAISQAIIGEYLADLFNDVITVDPHLHRTHKLSDIFPHGQAISISAAHAMTEFLASYKESILIGPDMESEQWVSSIAKTNQMGYAVASKQRFGDRQVTISLPDIDYQDKSIILIDDVISSGETVAICAQQCLAKGAKSVDALVTHALFAPEALDRLHQSGIGNVWSTDSISHSSNEICLDSLLAQTLKQSIL